MNYPKKNIRPRYISDIVEDAKSNGVSSQVSEKITKIENEFLIKYGRGSLKCYEDKIIKKVYEEYKKILDSKKKPFYKRLGLNRNY